MNRNTISLSNIEDEAGGVRRTTARMFNRNRANNNGAGARPSPIAVPQRLNNNGAAGQLVMSPFQGPPASPNFAPVSPNYGAQAPAADELPIPSWEENIVPPNNEANENNGNAPGIASAPAPNQQRGGIHHHRKHKKRTHKRRAHKKKTHKRKH